MIAVDNMIIAWGLSATTDPAHAELAARARTFFTNLTEDVLVPAPVLAEFLVEVPLERC